MRINMRLAAAEARASELYSGDSSPLTRIKPGQASEILDEAWWRTADREEGVDSSRHAAALRLYREIGREAAFELADGEFPACFDFDGGAARPDKGAVKTFLENGLLTSRHMGAQLVFALTDEGRARVERASS